jgi:hypothetical protein
VTLIVRFSVLFYSSPSGALYFIKREEVSTDYKEQISAMVTKTWLAAPISPTPEFSCRKTTHNPQFFFSEKTQFYTLAAVYFFYFFLDNGENSGFGLLKREASDHQNYKHTQSLTHGTVFNIINQFVKRKVSDLSWAAKAAAFTETSFGIQIRLGELMKDLSLKWRMCSLRDVEMLLPISAIRKCFCTAASYRSSLS